MVIEYITESVYEDYKQKIAGHIYDVIPNLSDKSLDYIVRIMYGSEINHLPEPCLMPVRDGLFLWWGPRFESIAIKLNGQVSCGRITFKNNEEIWELMADRFSIDRKDFKIVKIRSMKNQRDILRMMRVLNFLKN